MLLIFEYTKDFLVKYKYALRKDLKADSINFARSIYGANDLPYSRLIALK